MPMRFSSMFHSFARERTVLIARAASSKWRGLVIAHSETVFQHKGRNAERVEPFGDGAAFFYVGQSRVASAGKMTTAAPVALSFGAR